MVKNRKKGLALIVTMGILLVLSTTSVTFVRLTSYERSAASNYKDRVEAKLAAFAGIDHAAAILYEQARNGNTGQEVNGVNVLYPHSPDDAAYDLDNAVANRERLSLHNNIQGQFSYSGLVGRRIGGGVVRGTYDDNGNLYGLKIVDLGGRLNVNSHISTDLAGNTIPPEQQDSNRIMNGIIRELARQCDLSNASATSIADALRSSNNANVPNHTFAGVVSIVEGIEGGTISAAGQEFLNNVCTASRINPRTAKANLVNNAGTVINPENLRAGDYRANVAPQYVIERRAAINLNRVSEELLTALIMRTKGIPALLISRVDRIDDSTFGILSGDRLQKEREIQHRIPRLEVRFTEDQAEEIAEHLIGQTYATQASINEAIDNIESINPLDGLNAAELVLLDSDNFFPVLPTTELKVLFGNLDFGDGDEDLVKLKILWKQACRDILKSNFNPNTIDNFWNPNHSVRLLGVKANLFGTAASPTEFLITVDTQIVNHHTTELTAFDDGVYEITSSSRITAGGGTFTAGACTFRSELRVFEVEEHSNQRDFLTGTFGSDTMSFPGRHEIALGDNTLASPFAGRVEPRPQLINPNPSGSVLFNTGSASESSAPSNADHFLGTNNTTLTNDKAEQIAKIRETTNIDVSRRENNILDPNVTSNIVNDGLISTARFYVDGEGAINESAIRYYGKYALDNAPIGSNGSSDRSGNNNAALRDVDAGGDADGDLSNHRVGNYQGTIEFWVKLAVDGDSPTECGILSFSTIGQEKSGPVDLDNSATETFREGTQTFLVKDTEGRLKLTRYYFCGYFDRNNDENATILNTNGDINRVFAKRDVSIDISDWKANTWHHVIVSWDDKTRPIGSLGLVNGSATGFLDVDTSLTKFKDNLSLVVDNRDADGDAALAQKQSYFEVSTILGGIGQPRYVIIAERDVFGLGDSEAGNGLNYIFLNGVLRRQNNIGNANKFFQHNSGVYLGNATIDNVISYREKLAGVAALNRFPLTSTYSNTITVTSRGILGVLRWTAYSDSTKYDIAGNSFIEGSGTFNGANVFVYPANRTDTGGDGRGLPAIGAHSVEPGDTVTYNITFRAPANAGAGIGSISPALDSIQMTVLTFEYLDFEEIGQ